MRARIVIQKFENGQTNVCITQDKEVVMEDFVVGGADESEIVIGEVLILSDDPRITEALAENELRSVDNITDISPVTGYIRDRL